MRSLRASRCRVILHQHGPALRGKRVLFRVTHFLTSSPPVGWAENEEARQPYTSASHIESIGRASLLSRAR